MIKRLAIAFAAALTLLCSACGQSADVISQAPSEPAGPALVISDSTDPSSQGTLTTMGISPTTQMKGSDTASGSSSTGSVTPDNSHDPTIIVPPTLYATGGPSGSTAPHTSGSKSKPASGTTATTTTGKQETSQTTTRPSTTASTTTTTATVKSPWIHPYDISTITQECKKEIARVGLVWSDSLVGLPGRDGKPIGLPAGMSESNPSIDWAGWDNPYSTVLYTTYPHGYTFGDYVFDGNLKNYVFGDLIPFYLENREQYSLKRCKIWFEPLPDCPGDYNIYFLYSNS